MGKAKRFHKRRKLGGIPFVGVFFSMTLALFILGIFGGLMLFAKEFTRKIRENVEIQVFLQRSVTESQIIAVRSTLSSMPFVAQKNGRAQITFVSKDDAAEAFSKEIGEDFVRYIGENPLSDLFIVRVAEDSQNPAQLRNIKAKIESLRSVLEVAYVEKLVESIYENITKLGILFVSLMVLLFIAVVVIMHHAIRLSLFSQRFLVRSMQLVGATAGFIKRPFLLRSVHIDTRRMNTVRIQRTYGDDFFYFSDGDFACWSHNRIKISRRMPIHQVPRFVSLPGLNKCIICLHPMLHQVWSAIKIAYIFAFLHLRTVSNGRKKGRNACACGAYAFYQGPLWNQLYVQLLTHKLSLKLRIFAHIRGDHFSHLPLFHQQTDAKVINSCIV